MLSVALVFVSIAQHKDGCHGDATGWVWTCNHEFTDSAPDGRTDSEQVVHTCVPLSTDSNIHSEL